MILLHQTSLGHVSAHIGFKSNWRVNALARTATETPTIEFLISVALFHVKRVLEERILPAWLAWWPSLTREVVSTSSPQHYSVTTDLFNNILRNSYAPHHNSANMAKWESQIKPITAPWLKRCTSNTPIYSPKSWLQCILSQPALLARLINILMDIFILTSLVLPLCRVAGVRECSASFDSFHPLTVERLVSEIIWNCHLSLWTLSCEGRLCFSDLSLLVNIFLLAENVILRQPTRRHTVVYRDCSLLLAVTFRIQNV